MIGDVSDGAAREPIRPDQDAERGRRPVRAPDRRSSARTTPTRPGRHGLRHALPRCARPGRREATQTGTLEVWDIYNTTGDTHPIHFHLVNVQILGRAPFAHDDDGNPVGRSSSTGPCVPPDANERGWKETVRMNPGEVTRVIMKFDLPPDPVVNVLGRNRRDHRADEPAHGRLRVRVALPHPRARRARHDASAGRRSSRLRRRACGPAGLVRGPRGLPGLGPVRAERVRR